MKKTQCVVVVALLLIIGNIYGQTLTGAVPGKAIDLNTGAFGYITEVAYSEEKIVGNIYLFDDWTSCVLKINNREYEGIMLNYNMKNRNIEIKDGDKLKTVGIDMVESFRDAYGNTYQRTSNLVNKDGVRLLGICKVVSETDKWDLIVAYQLILIESNYVPALDVGDKTSRLEKKEKYFLVRNGRAYELSNSKKKIRKELANEHVDLEPFFKENNLDIKDSNDLAALINYLNQQS